MKTKIILSLVSITILGLCLLGALVGMSMKNGNSSVEYICSLAVVVSCVLIGVNQLVIDLHQPSPPQPSPPHPSPPQPSPPQPSPPQPSPPQPSPPQPSPSQDSNPCSIHEICRSPACQKYCTDTIGTWSNEWTLKEGESPPSTFNFNNLAFQPAVGVYKLFQWFFPTYSAVYKNNNGKEFYIRAAGNNKGGFYMAFEYADKPLSLCIENWIQKDKFSPSTFASQHVNGAETGVSGLFGDFLELNTSEASTSTISFYTNSNLGPEKINSFPPNTGICCNPVDTLILKRDAGCCKSPGSLWDCGILLPKSECEKPVVNSVPQCSWEPSGICKQ
jgi:hypothetical protein